MAGINAVTAGDRLMPVKKPDTIPVIPNVMETTKNSPTNCMYEHDFELEMKILVKYAEITENIIDNIISTMTINNVSIIPCLRINHDIL